MLSAHWVPQSGFHPLAQRAFIQSCDQFAQKHRISSFVFPFGTRRFLNAIRLEQSLNISPVISLCHEAEWIGIILSKRECGERICSASCTVRPRPPSPAKSREVIGQLILNIHFAIAHREAQCQSHNRLAGRKRIGQSGVVMGLANILRIAMYPHAKPRNSPTCIHRARPFSSSVNSMFQLFLSHPRRWVFSSSNGS